MEPQASWTGFARVKMERDEREHLGLSGEMTATAGNAIPSAADPKPVVAQLVQQPPSDPPAEQAVVQGGGDQQQNQEDDNSDTDSLSPASSSIAERPASKATAPTETAGVWTATTASKAMKKLVRDREEIFAAQREARADRLQEISREKVETALSQSGTSNGPYLSAFRNYMAFCSRVDVPPFPITYATVALWVFEKCSNRDGYFHTYRHGVGLAADMVESLWTTHPVFRTMRQFDKHGTALSEFLEERRVAHTSSSSNTSPKSAVKAASKPRRAPRQYNVLEMDSHEFYLDRRRAQRVVRALPTRNSVYDSITDIYKTYVAAIVPVYGISVVALNTSQKNVHIRCNRYHSTYASHPGGICSWVAFCRRRPDGKFVVDFDASNFEQSHGPCREILADPKWRPVVRNPDARAVLGMDPLPNQTRYKKQVSDEPPPHKKARLSQTTSSAKYMPPPPVPTRPPTSVAPRPQLPSLAAPPRWSPSAQQSYLSPVSPSTPQGSSARSAGTPLLNKPVSAAATSSNEAPRIPSPLTTWNPAPSFRPSSQPPVVAAATPVAAGSPSTPADPVELVSAFCAGLHPSLVSLAEPLVAAGVYSFNELVALRVLGPHQLEHFLSELRKIHSERRAKSPSLPPLSSVHVLLFAKYIKA